MFTMEAIQHLLNHRTLFSTMISVTLPASTIPASSYLHSQINNTEDTDYYMWDWNKWTTWFLGYGTNREYGSHGWFTEHRPRCIKLAFERKSDKSNANWFLTNQNRALRINLRLIFVICVQTQILCNGVIVSYTMMSPNQFQQKSVFMGPLQNWVHYRFSWLWDYKGSPWKPCLILLNHVDGVLHHNSFLHHDVTSVITDFFIVLRDALL